jgi:hypothetical protein
MSDDRGLSIFDEEQPGEDSPTQVMPQVQGDAAPAAQPQERPAASPPAERTATRRSAPVIPPAASPETPAARPAAAAPTLPLVRRGGYDKDAVDNHLRTVAAEKAGLIASLHEAQTRLRTLEAQVTDLREKLAENETPSYAGLGGMSSELLRLAEEQA